MTRREIIETLSEIYANLVYGTQTETTYALKIREIVEGLNEY